MEESGKACVPNEKYPKSYVLIRNSTRPFQPKFGEKLTTANYCLLLHLNAPSPFASWQKKNKFFNYSSHQVLVTTWR